MEVKQLLTLDEAAARLGLKAVTLRMWASRRKIARCKIGRSVRIPAAEVERLIETSLIPALPERSR